jgi:hypothetical protein
MQGWPEPYVQMKHLNDVWNEKTLIQSLRGHTPYKHTVLARPACTFSINSSECTVVYATGSGTTSCLIRTLPLTQGGAGSCLSATAENKV